MGSEFLCLENHSQHQHCQNSGGLQIMYMPIGEKNIKF